MAIDKPTDAFEQQWFPDSDKSPLGLVAFGARVAFPKAGLLVDIFRKAAERLSRPSMEERLRETWKMVVNEVGYLETTKASHEDVVEAIQLIMRRDAEQFNDKKRDRYVKLIGNALRSETQIQDVVSFVQTIEQLNERDVAVLKVLNRVMNKESDWKSSPHSADGGIKKLHPSTLIGRRQELTVQVAMALGQDVERNTFSREEGYSICNRLKGFGLAHELDAQHRELPLTDYIFRLSNQGARLLKLVGEDVQNYDCYGGS